MSRRKRSLHQKQLFDNDPVYSHQHAAAVVGEFFEHLTAKTCKGWRVQVDDASGYNPDIETKQGAEIESKSSARSRWMIAEQQLEHLENRPGSFFVFWRYPYSRENLISRFETKAEIWSHLGISITAAYAVSSPYLRHLAETKLVKGLDHGAYMQVKHQTLQEVVDGRLKLAIPEQPTISRRLSRQSTVLGIPVRPFTLYSVDNGVQPVAPPF